MATTSAHILGSVEAFDASEAGALPGHQVRCSCGHVVRTSLSASFARADAEAHVAYMARRGDGVRPRRSRRVAPWER